MPNYRNKKLLELCRELPCQVCGRNNGTVVAAHRNEGKGIGLKVSDALVASLCFECHSEMDNGKTLTKEERRDMWNRAYINTIQQFIEREWLVIK
jgi:hypothetical protein